ncbi:MAG TPA: ATP-binding protein, partial [Bryobacteraceae bacterium]|nr:ATP-binding protein [Bryobacteraceae bacterium]
PVAAIYGANASGKTNVISALEFVKKAVESSQREWKPDGPIPRQPFLLDDESSRASPSEFVVDTIVQGIRYQYGFAVTDKAVTEEWLNAYPNGKKQAWFSRKSGKPITFSSKMGGENRTIEALTRPNSLFLSAAAQNNHESLTPIYKWFSDRLFFVTSSRSAYRFLTVALCKQANDKIRISELLRIADLGIDDLSLKEENVPGLLETIHLSTKGISPEEFVSRLSVTITEPSFDFELLHHGENGPVPFPMTQESQGTIAYLSMLGPLLQAMDQGGVICIDELDASLHPLVAIQIIKIFNHSTGNKAGAQLIFNTHDVNLLSYGMRRDQIWFTEKGRDGASQLYPLTDFKPRMGENIHNGYLQGRYGAIPFLNSDSFMAAVEAADEKE